MLVLSNLSQNRTMTVTTAKRLEGRKSKKDTIVRIYDGGTASSLSTPPVAVISLTEDQVAELKRNL
jgi:hypothetical protein